MDREKLFLSNYELWTKTAREMSLLVNSFQKECMDPFPSKEEIEKEIFFEKIKDTEMIYLYGIGLGTSYDYLKKWLKKDPTRALIYLEDDPLHIGRFLRLKKAGKILQDPQVELHYIAKEHKEIKLSHLAYLFADKSSQIFPSYHYRKRKNFKDLKEELFRKISLSQGMLAENQIKKQLLDNFIQNSEKVFSSFFMQELKNKFQGMPAIICGAGPTLEDSVANIKENQNKALIFAGGSTISALSFHGIIPHIGVAIDPMPTEYDRLKICNSFSFYLAYSMRVFGKIFDLFNVEKGFCPIISEKELMKKALSIDSESFLDEGLNDEACSVTLLTTAIAHFLGCDPIIFCGVDLAYVNQQRYAEGVVSNNQIKTSEEFLEEKDYQGKKIFTNIRWMMEKASFSNFVEKCKKSKFITASNRGLKIENIPFEPFEKIEEKYLQKQLDISSLLHANLFAIKELSSESDFKRKSFIKSLIKSFKQCKKHVENILTILQKQPKGQKNFKPVNIFLDEIEVQDIWLYSSFLYAFQTNPSEEEKVNLTFQKKRFFHLNEMIDYYLKMIFDRFGID